LVALLKVEGKLALREPYGLGGGIAFPLILLIVFAYISSMVPGNVAHTGLTVLDLYIPTLIVIAFLAIALTLPRTMVRDREIGWLRRVSTTPVHPWRLLAVQLILNVVLAVAAVAIIVFGGAVIFGAPLHVAVPYFILAIILAIAEIFSLGLVVVALAPSQTVANTLTGLLMLPLLFLSGLWVQPAQVGGILQTIMYYSPGGAAGLALLAAVFNTAPPFATLLTMALYTVIFAFIAIRFFRWE
jgi:ABC-2 type transport system permease protein